VATVQMKESVGEATFALHCQVHDLKPLRECRFAEPRKWRFDFAFPVSRIAVEIEGGTRMNGRHNRHDGFEKDAEKYNEAAIRGWRVLRFTTEQVKSGLAIDTLLRAFGI
jgi:very-short-patch-repair endonuclease